jgi:primosomal protein N' (replication factor Y)
MSIVYKWSRFNLDNFYKFSSEIKNPLKLEFLNRYKDSEYLTIYEILANYDISYYMVKDLYKKGFLEIKKERTLRIKNRNISYINELEEISSETVSKTIEKLTTINSIPYLYMPSSINELNEVLVNVCKNVIENDKNIVIVCADILSSVKYASIIRKLLNVNVACINSNLSRGELLDLYTEIKNDIYEVIVTTPKGAFYPFQNVGMYFMLDEESDNYYNDQSPRYDLHKALYFLSYNSKANFVMSSISPSVSKPRPGVTIE